MKKRGKYDKNIRNTMNILDGILQAKNELFVMIHPRNACKM